MKQLLRSALNRCGFDIVRMKNLHQDHAQHLRNVLASRSIDCVIDVGANVGQYGAFLRGIGYEGHIVSFEPARSVFGALAAKARDDPKWTCHNVALGDREETKTLNVYGGTQFSSFLKVTDYAKGVWSDLDTVAPEQVPVARLDALFPVIKKATGATSVMLKIDTQGYDHVVFEGARGCLGNVAVLQSEVSFIPVYDGSVSGYDLLAAFHREEFFVSGMYPINRDASLAVIEFDCVLVRRSAPKAG